MAPGKDVSSISRWAITLALLLLLLLLAWGGQPTTNDSSISLGISTATETESGTSEVIGITRTPIYLKVHSVAIGTRVPSFSVAAVATPAPSSTPTVAPPLEEPVRLVIPLIRLRAKIESNGGVDGSRATTYRTVVHDASSSLPGEGSNVALIGHNNYNGSVFRYLYRLKIGDEIELQTRNFTFRYVVRMKDIFPYESSSSEGARKLLNYLAPTKNETLTLISCYPYLTNTHRVVIVAEFVLSSLN